MNSIPQPRFRMNFNCLREKVELEDWSFCISESLFCQYIRCEGGQNKKKEIKGKRIGPVDFKQPIEDIILRTNRTSKGLRNLLGFSKPYGKAVSSSYVGRLDNEVKAFKPPIVSTAQI